MAFGDVHFHCIASFPNLRHIDPSGFTTGRWLKDAIFSEPLISQSTCPAFTANLGFISIKYKNLY
jgi:hypothetical protein